MVENEASPAIKYEIEPFFDFEIKQVKLVSEYLLCFGASTSTDIESILVYNLTRSNA